MDNVITALLVSSAFGLLATASLGFCPACHLGGRRTLSQRLPCVRVAEICKRSSR